jgi:transposase
MRLEMVGKRATPEKIIGQLRQADVELAQGKTVGEVDRIGRISRCGDTLGRTLLCEAAVVIVTRVKRASGLKDWAQAIAKRSGLGKARVALARKLSVILHSIWRSGDAFRWSERPAGA